MENSSNIPSNFIDEVETFSKGKLNKKAELTRLYEEAVSKGKEMLFTEAAFTAKYLRGLMRVLQSGLNIPEVKNLVQVKKDFSNNIEKIKAQLKDIISSSDNSLKNHFEEHFFEMSQEGLTNLNELLSDLEQVKIYLNNQKSGKKN